MIIEERTEVTSCQGRFEWHFVPAMDGDEMPFEFNRCSDCREWIVVHNYRHHATFTGDTPFEEVVRESFRLLFEKKSLSRP